MLTGIIAIVAYLATAAAQTPADTAGCTLERRTLPLFDATPAAIVAATPVSTDPGPGASADEIEDAVTVIVACINTGEPQLMYAIYTDRHLAEMYADPTQTYLPEFERELERNQVEAADQFTLEGVSEIAWRDDGRVSVTIALSNGLTTFRDTLLLASQDGTWLIDGVEALDPPV